jgi:hypothetical protein
METVPGWRPKTVDLVHQSMIGRFYGHSVARRNPGFFNLLTPAFAGMSVTLMRD